MTNVSYRRVVQARYVHRADEARLNRIRETAVNLAQEVAGRRAARQK